MTKIVAISDVHGRWNKLTIPECDVLISCGDYSFRGEKHIVKDFHRWLGKQPAKKIISVQGNHELWVRDNFQEAKAIAEQECPGVFFIEEDVIEIEGIKIFASAWTLFFHNWAYNEYPDEIRKRWNRIPDDIDIIITHGQPYGILDELGSACGDPSGQHVGDHDLARRIKEIKPDLYFGGHLHFQGGQQVHIDGTSYYNCANCDDMYMISNPITIVEYSK